MVHETGNSCTGVLSVSDEIGVHLPIGCGIRVNNFRFDLDGVLDPVELNLGRT